MKAQAAISRESAIGRIFPIPLSDSRVAVIAGPPAFLRQCSAPGHTEHCFQLDQEIHRDPMQLHDIRVR